MNWSKSHKVFPTLCAVVQALIPAKRKRQIPSSMVVALFFGFTAQAQTADWQAVQNLKPGSYILVKAQRSEEHTSELQSHSDLVCRPLLEKKNTATCGYVSPASRC